MEQHSSIFGGEDYERVLHKVVGTTIKGAVYPCQRGQATLFCVREQHAAPWHSHGLWLQWVCGPKPRECFVTIVMKGTSTPRSVTVGSNA